MSAVAASEHSKYMTASLYPSQAMGVAWGAGQEEEGETRARAAGEAGTFP